MAYKKKTWEFRRATEVMEYHTLPVHRTYRQEWSEDLGE